MCDGAHIRELGQGGRGRRRKTDARTRACAVHYARASLVSDGGPTATSKKRSLSYRQCENERGYRLRATENAMRFINSLRGPPLRRVIYEKIEIKYFCNLMYFNWLIFIDIRYRRTIFPRDKKKPKEKKRRPVDRFGKSIIYLEFLRTCTRMFGLSKLTFLGRNNRASERGTSGCSRTNEDLRVFEKIMPGHFYDVI